MLFRKWFFLILSLLSIMWILLGFSITSQVAREMKLTPIATSSYSAQPVPSTARDAGIFLGSSISVSIFLCTGLPLLAIFGLLSWRNAVGLRNQKRDQIMMEYQRQQTNAAHQAAVAQEAQAQMRYASIPQPVVYQAPALSAPQTDYRAQLNAASALIKAKQYDAARDLLTAMNHPTAREWLVKLDRLQPRS